MALEIELTNCKGPYVAGSRILGRVMCDLIPSDDIQVISMQLQGIEKVWWKANGRSHEKEDKFLGVVSLMSGPATSGRVVYPFKFNLPEDIPSSYGDKYGMVTYSLNAIVHSADGSEESAPTKRVFYVIAPQAFSTMEDKSILDPGSYEGEMTVSGWCTTAGHISMKVGLEKKAFVPKEVVKVDVRIFNNSQQTIKNVKALLRTIVRASVSPSESIEDKTVVAETEVDGFGPCDEKSYQILLKLPSFEVPNFSKCKLLSYRCELEVVGVLSLLHPNLIVTVPVILGDFAGGQVETYAQRLTDLGALNDQNMFLVYKRLGLLDDASERAREVLQILLSE